MREHETDMPHCWCNPKKEVMPNDNILIVHNEEHTKDITIEVLKIGGKWTVQFGYGVQSFTLQTIGKGSTKAEAEWMADMLRKMFSNYEDNLKN